MDLFDDDDWAINGEKKFCDWEEQMRVVLYVVKSRIACAFGAVIIFAANR